ncbi:MAG: T9SS C-terminal target domain-containing protein, partial [Chitinophagia bacterium]|nr:T9SS C-terminal target domain-containing protein [Chitinophagia bacterium]
PGATSRNYSYTTAGRYTVKVTDANGCSVTSAVYVVDITTAVAEVTSGIDISIYPNPSTAIVHIEAPGKVNVMVLSSVGQMVAEKSQTNEIDLSQLADGVYLIKVLDDHQNTLKIARVVKVQ